MAGAEPILLDAGASDIFITEELAQRAPRVADYLQEKIALQDLARQMADNPDGVLALLVRQAMDLTGATAAGLSLYEAEPAPGIFRWHHLHGELARFNGATTPRNFSPCGVTLDRCAVTLVKHPELVYDWVADAGITLEEVLLVPLYVGSDEPLGTLWVTAQEPGYFDSGHARVLAEQAAFAGIALQMSRTEDNLEAALERQELLIREMSHRMNNVFAVFEGLTRMTARGAKTAADMALALSGRVRSLGRAHALARARPGEAIAGDLSALIAAILRPYEDPDNAARIRISGAPIEIGDRVLSALALVFHELATNAAKYGALSVPEGRVAVSWEIGEALVLSWQEEAGPMVSGAPEVAGFGTTLAQTSVEQFAGTISRDWRAEGLHVSITVPAAKLRER